MLLDYRTLRTKIKSAWAKTTSVLSSMLKIVSPQWIRAETAWKAWTWTKRGIALGVLVGVGVFAWRSGAELPRLAENSARPSYVFGKRVTSDDLKNLADKSDISRIQRQIDDLKSQLSKIDDTIDKAQAQSSRITTGSLPKKKKPAPVKASQSYRLVLP